MMITPKIRGFICTTTHPLGCQKNVEQQIEVVRSQPPINLPFKRILVIGGSTGYGLASRIVASFGWGADTLNVSLERPYVDKNDSVNVKPASPGWYQTAHFEKLARAEGRYAETLIGDAFSDEIKKEALDKIKVMGPIDMVIYSVAAPKRVDPKDGKEYRSVLKTIGDSDRKKSLNATRDGITEVEVASASEEEIEATIKVMGGEDWKLWIKLLEENNLLAPNFVTLAFSYIGPEVTQAIYRQGTIGRAKLHLEKSAAEITGDNQLNGKAYISVNKGLVTQAASAIPILPLYLSLLYRVMKDQRLHEGCIEQIRRLFGEKMNYHQNELQIEVDKNNFIRLDDWEMKDEIQSEVANRMAKVDDDNLKELADIEGYQKDFLQLFGFEVEGVDYQQEVENEVLKTEILS